MMLPIEDSILSSYKVRLLLEIEETRQPRVNQSLNC